MSRLTIPAIKPSMNSLYMKKPNVYKADCIEKLGRYETLEEEGRLVELPCVIGDTLYTNFAVQGWYFREKNKPYATKVVFIGINDVDNFISVAYENGNTLQFDFSDIGKRIFLTKEEAKKKLEEIEGEEE